MQKYVEWRAYFKMIIVAFNSATERKSIAIIYTYLRHLKNVVLQPESRKHEFSILNTDLLLSLGLYKRD